MLFFQRENPETVARWLNVCQLYTELSLSYVVNKFQISQRHIKYKQQKVFVCGLVQSVFPCIRMVSFHPSTETISEEVDGSRCIFQVLCQDFAEVYFLFHKDMTFRYCLLLIFLDPSPFSLPSTCPVSPNFLHTLHIMPNMPFAANLGFALLV